MLLDDQYTLQTTLIRVTNKIRSLEERILELEERSTQHYDEIEYIERNIIEIEENYAKWDHQHE